MCYFRLRVVTWHHKLHLRQCEWSHNSLLHHIVSTIFIFLSAENNKKWKQSTSERFFPFYLKKQPQNFNTLLPQFAETYLLVFQFAFSKQDHDKHQFEHDVQVLPSCMNRTGKSFITVSVLLRQASMWTSCGKGEKNKLWQNLIVFKLRFLPGDETPDPFFFLLFLGWTNELTLISFV